MLFTIALTYFGAIAINQFSMTKEERKTIIY